MPRYGLPLSGYDKYSVWGYDTQMETYFAQLWRNTSDGFDDPDTWLSGMQPIASAPRLAVMIAASTGTEVSDVVIAMAAARSAPEYAELLGFLAQIPAEDRGMTAQYALPIAGWDEASTWGFDELAAGFWAKLYRNGSDPAGRPLVWLHPESIETPIEGPDALAVLVSRMIGGISALDVVLAFAAAVPAADEPENSRYLRELAESWKTSDVLSRPAAALGRSA